MSHRLFNPKSALDFAAELSPSCCLYAEEVKPLGRAFGSNVSRVIELAELPSVLMGMGSSIRRLWINACHVVTGQLEVPSTHEKRDETISKFAELMNAEQPWEIDKIRDALGDISTASHVGGPYFNNAFLLVFAAQITGAWTAFEVLSKDLWVVAVNCNAEILGVNAAKAEEKFPITRLQKYDFNLQNAMGDLLYPNHDFDGLGGIQAAYLSAFKDDAGPLSDVFRDLKLKCAYAIRNAIVHNAGIADENFTGRVAEDPFWSTIKEREPIPLDPKHASDIALGTIKCGERLIEFVDRWLINHTDKYKDIRDALHAVAQTPKE